MVLIAQSPHRLTFHTEMNLTYLAMFALIAFVHLSLYVVTVSVCRIFLRTLLSPWVFFRWIHRTIIYVKKIINYYIYTK